MKAILNYDLPEEQAEYKLAMDGGKWHLVVWDMDQWLRNKLKYGNEFKTADEALEAARNELNEYMKGMCLDLYGYE